MAFVAGGLAAVNPCGFALLPAYVAVFVQSDDHGRVPARIAHGLRTGALLTTGCLAVFALVALPVTLGASLVAQAVPFVGMALGVGLISLGIVTLAGFEPVLRVPRLAAVDPNDHGAALVFGAAYGLASLGCTLPVLLAFTGVTAGAPDVAFVLATFSAFAAGMALVFLALGISLALVHDGISRALRRVVPRVQRASGALVWLAGAYLLYYWIRVPFGPASTLSSDPVVGPITRFTAGLQPFAEDHAGLLIGLLAGIVLVAVTLMVTGRARLRTRAPVGDVR